MVKRTLTELVSSIDLNNNSHTTKRRCCNKPTSFLNPLHDFASLPIVMTTTTTTEDSGSEADTEVPVVVNQKIDNIICGKYGGDYFDGVFRSAIVEQHQRTPQLTSAPTNYCQAIVPYVSVHSLLGSAEDDNENQNDNFPVAVDSEMDLD